MFKWEEGKKICPQPYLHEIRTLVTQRTTQDIGCTDRRYITKIRSKVKIFTQTLNHNYTSRLHRTNKVIQIMYPQSDKPRYRYRYKYDSKENISSHLNFLFS